MSVPRRDIEEFKELDRLATEQANKRGTRPNMHPAHAALVAGVGVFFLLDIFAALVMDDLQSALLPVLALTGLVAGAAYHSNGLRGPALVAALFAPSVAEAKPPCVAYAGNNRLAGSTLWADDAFNSKYIGDGGCVQSDGRRH